MNEETKINEFMIKMGEDLYVLCNGDDGKIINLASKFLGSVIFMASKDVETFNKVLDITLKSIKERSQYHMLWVAKHADD